MILVHLNEFNRGNTPSRNNDQVPRLERHIFAFARYRFLVVKWDAYLLSILFAKDINGVGFCKGSDSSGHSKQLQDCHISVERKSSLMAYFANEVDFPAADGSD